MNTEIKITHRETEIVYDEKDNVFRFTLRGRERSAPSLTAAKEAIDKPPPNDKKPFGRIKAWWERSYGGRDFRQVEVTSIAESPSWSRSAEVWIFIPAGKAAKNSWSTERDTRQKVDAKNVFPCNERNNALVAECQKITKEIDSLGKNRSKICKKLVPIKVESEKSDG